MSKYNTLLESSTLVEKLFNSFNGGLILLSHDEVVIFVNEWVKEHSNDFHQNTLNKQFVDIFPELIDTRVHEGIKNALENGFPAVISNVLNRHPFPFYNPSKLEKSIQPQVAERIFQAIQITPIGESGNRDYCAIFINDVSPSVLREETLKNQIDEKNSAVKELDQQNKLFEAGPSVVFKLATEDNFPIEYVSPNLYQQFFYQAQEIIEKKSYFTDFIHADDIRAYKDHIQLNIENNSNHFEQEYRIIDGKGNIRWVNDFTTVIRSDSGKISYFHGYLIDVSEHKLIENQIKKQAYYDSLTSLPNRRMLTERLNQDIYRARRHKFFSALLFMDLDNFKYINDSLGHGVGDELLVEVSQRITQRIRMEDMAARIGGDEFVIVLSELDKDIQQAALKGKIIADSIREKISAPYHIRGNELHTSTSIGLVIFPRPDDESQKIIQHADTAMYHAKAAGRNDVRFFTEEMQLAADNRINLEKNLRMAVGNNELCLMYQPQVNNAGEIIACESLVRWSKDGKIISPADFIPVAEETGIIIDIGEWVLRESCRQFKVWQKENSTGQNIIKHIAVNISPKQFRDANFIHFVESALQSFEMNPAELELEITEGIVIADVEDTIKKMHHLKSLGVRLAMDDFGTGYSSLSYLKNLPLDVLKIDQSFIRDASQDPNDKAIVATIISMAKHLDMVTVAEGIEDKLILQHLNIEGCSIFQGYYISRPISGEKFSEFLRNWDSSLFS